MVNAPILYATLIENIRMDYVPRSADGQILKWVEDDAPHKNVLLVEGARQVGKTFLVEHALGTCRRKSFAVDLERESLIRSLIDGCSEFKEFQDLLHDRMGFDSQADHILFIDEAQESRKLGQFVRFMKEEWPRATVILSGSTLARLFRDDSRYPVGRVQRLVLGPFTFSEFLVATGNEHLARAVLSEDPHVSGQRHEHLLSLYDGYLLTGGLPAVVLAYFRKRDHKEVLAQIIADYEQDFVRIFGERDADIAKACLHSVANFVGTPSKNTTVLPSPGTHTNARINEIFARLESWHLVLRSEQKGPGPEAGHHYLPKRYLFDTGMLRRLRESAVPSIRLLSTLAPLARYPLGGVIENQTAIEWARMGDDLCGWKKTPSGGEIDFIIKRGMATYPVECKATLTFNKRHLRGLQQYLAMYCQSLGFVVSLAPYMALPIEHGVQVVNFPIYFLERLHQGFTLPDLLQAS